MKNWRCKKQISPGEGVTVSCDTLSSWRGPKKSRYVCDQSNGIIHTMPFWDERFSMLAKHFPKVQTDQDRRTTRDVGNAMLHEIDGSYIVVWL